MDLGAINLLFLYRKPSMQEIASLKFQYFSDVLWDVYFVFWPSILSNASTFLQFRILRCMLFELIILFSSWCFWSTEISSSKSSFVSSKKALLCVSAENIVFPALKVTFKSHFLSESSCLCSLARAWCKRIF